MEEILDLQYVAGSEDMLLKSLSKTNAPSQASRLKCLASVIKNLPEQNEKYLFKIVPETVLCIKAANEKARSGKEKVYNYVFTLIMESRPCSPFGRGEGAITLELIHVAHFDLFVAFWVRKNPCKI